MNLLQSMHQSSMEERSSKEALRVAFGSTQGDVPGLLHAWLNKDCSLNLPELPQHYIAAPDGLDESIHS